MVPMEETPIRLFVFSGKKYKLRALTDIYFPTSKQLKVELLQLENSPLRIDFGIPIICGSAASEESAFIFLYPEQ